MRAPDMAADDLLAAPVSLRTARAALSRTFAEVGIDTPALDARRLLSAATALSEADQLREPDRVLSMAQRARLRDFAARRLAREPVGRIVGVREFHGLDIHVSADTLEPRPDSETLVDAALGLIACDRPVRVLDAGTGSGCLLLAVLANAPRAWGLGIDRSTAVLIEPSYSPAGLAERAAFAVGDWLAGVAGAFDVIVANPPYVRRGDLAGLAPEVSRFDPIAALDGGPDGLDHYRTLVPQARACLAPGGTLALEIGADQAAQVGELVRAAGFARADILRDLAGRERVVVARG